MFLLVVLHNSEPALVCRHSVEANQSPDLRPKKRPDFRSHFTYWAEVRNLIDCCFHTRMLSGRNPRERRHVVSTWRTCRHSGDAERPHRVTPSAGRLGESSACSDRPAAAGSSSRLLSGWLQNRSEQRSSSDRRTLSIRAASCSVGSGSDSIRHLALGLPFVEASRTRNWAVSSLLNSHTSTFMTIGLPISSSLPLAAVSACAAVARGAAVRLDRTGYGCLSEDVRVQFVARHLAVYSALDGDAALCRNAIAVNPLLYGLRGHTQQRRQP
jgi:hypothetical protein